MNEKDGSRIEINALCNTRSCYETEEKTQGSPESDSDRDTDAATADSGENEVRRRTMRECEDAIYDGGHSIQTWICANGSMG